MAVRENRNFAKVPLFPCKNNENLFDYISRNPSAPAKDGFCYACGFYSLCLNIRLFFAFSVINRTSVKKPGKFVILALFSVYLFIYVGINMHYYLLFSVCG
jgi:hypothetical protein